MQRRRFLKGLATAAMAVMLPLQLTEFGGAASVLEKPFEALAPMAKLPLASMDASIRWMQLIYDAPILYRPVDPQILITMGAKHSGKWDTDAKT